MLQQTYFINLHLGCFTYKLIYPIKRVRATFNMDMSIYHVFPPVKVCRSDMN